MRMVRKIHSNGCSSVWAHHSIKMIWRNTKTNVAVCGHIRALNGVEHPFNTMWWCATHVRALKGLKAFTYMEAMDGVQVSGHSIVLTCPDTNTSTWVDTLHHFNAATHSYTTVSIELDAPHHSGFLTCSNAPTWLYTDPSIRRMIRNIPMP
jgi:hypothetical protein